MTLRLDTTPIDGLILVRPEPHVDERGAFARLYCATAFAAAGVDFRPTQISASFNPHRHTLRGMHWQAAPHGETKLVRVTRGRAFDVAIDLRDGSATRGHWFGCELTADNRHALLIPRGFAHGFLTLEADTELTYAMDADHVAEAATGARFDDPAFGIAWPAAPRMIGARDRTWPAWTP
jgi:dTDP-4-dehydrorhamnose 3,5-epimerase